MFIQKVKSIPHFRKLGSFVAVLAVAWSLVIVVQAYYPTTSVETSYKPPAAVPVMDTTADPKGVLGASTDKSTTPVQAVTTTPTQRSASLTSPTPTAESFQHQNSEAPVPVESPSTSPTPSGENTEVPPAPPQDQHDPTICTDKNEGCVDESDGTGRDTPLRTYKPLN